ncbi:MAG: hypothetical protein LBV69_07835 [Bacteroidales bacterium]|jgi:hypothetical protein|nr:hypothetical protein [Bacteroidales bacterium]
MKTILNLIRKSYILIIVFCIVATHIFFSCEHPDFPDFSNDNRIDTTRTIDTVQHIDTTHITDTAGNDIIIIDTTYTIDTIIHIDTVVIDFPELIVYEYDKGEIDWVSIQASTSADSKIADAKLDRGDTRVSNDTAYIQLLTIADNPVPFRETGDYIIVLKPKNSNKMYIKLAKTKFTNGCAIVKFGGWMAWNAK